ncbi:hypothetical protein RYA05_00880 [Pseudomonas syringae pv. actinidiae]|nr:hypothetical protein [Pseudomonas syringae pv. actinidiae]
MSSAILNVSIGLLRKNIRVSDEQVQAGIQICSDAVEHNKFPSVSPDWLFAICNEVQQRREFEVPITVESSDDYNYFHACLGDSYDAKNPGYGKHEASHPARIKEVMAENEGSKAADVIATLVFERELSRQREKRMYVDIIRLQQELKQKG